MKVAYDVNYDFTSGKLGGTRFRGKKSQREAFVFAKEVAKNYGSAFMTQIIWDDEKKIVSQKTVVIYANGKFDFV